MKNHSDFLKLKYKILEKHLLMVFIFWYYSRATQRETLEWTALQEFFKEFSNIFRMLSLNNTTGWLLPTKPVTKGIHLLTCFNNVFDLLEKENTTSCFNFNKFNANGAAVMVHLWFLFFAWKVDWDCKYFCGDFLF